MISSSGSGRRSMGLRLYQRIQIFIKGLIVFGHPPKFIWLRVGNCQTGLITNLLRSRYQVIRQFIESETESLLGPRTTADLNKPLQPYHDLGSLMRQFAIEHFVDRELKATLGNKRVDREHQHTIGGGWGGGRVGDRQPG